MGRMITVCEECHRASCWHGEYMCDEARSCGTIEMSEEELRKLNLEHPHHYSKKKIKEVCGIDED